jgi:2-polyprenyl-3-methyl-5-hydroxy-6-metoxy-1,4-benzoquinol methylase
MFMNNINKIKNMLRYTTTSKTSYNGKGFEGGYHTLNICDTVIPGQRKPDDRIRNVPYDFKNKTVLDIGSNQGGMLYSVHDKINEGVGIDFDYRLVNVANRIKSSHQYNNINFYVFDLNKEDFNLINNLSSSTYDIVFLLSVCMWIDTWRELCTWCATNIKSCLFETNGSATQQDEQVALLLTLYSKVALINKKSSDDPGKAKRRLYFCEN